MQDTHISLAHGNGGRYMRELIRDPTRGGIATVSYVLMETDIGGERIIEELEDDPLPRIC